MSVFSPTIISIIIDLWRDILISFTNFLNTILHMFEKIISYIISNNNNNILWTGNLNIE